LVMENCGRKVRVHKKEKMKSAGGRPLVPRLHRKKGSSGKRAWV